MKLKILLYDLFFVVSAIIGVGFATGREISHFFLAGKNLVLAVAIFFIVFVLLSLFFLKTKQKHNINSLSQLNKLAFGKYNEIGNIVLMVLLIVTSSAMLSGCDNLIKTYLGINIPFGSLFLSAITFFVVVGGVVRIKSIANIVMPLLIGLIVLNACVNINFSLESNGSLILDIAYPIIFCCENFIMLISVLLNTKSNSKVLGFVSGGLISLVVLLSALAISNLNTDMPMLTLSGRGGNIFFLIYLIGVIFALFTTLEISTYNCWQINKKNKQNNIFVLLLIILTNQLMAYLGFNFIVVYLYTGVGILSAIYLIILIIRLIIVNKKQTK